MAVFLPQRHVDTRHQREVEGHVAFVAVAEVRADVARPLVGLRKQHAGLVVRVDGATEVFEDLVRLGKALARGAFTLDEVRHGIEPHAVSEKYYYARRPEITRVVDISGVVDLKVEANRANRAKGPAGSHGSRLRAELAKQGRRLPLLGDDDATADRHYIKEFILERDRELGRKHGVEYAEAFHYIGPRPSRRVEDYIRDHAVPLEKAK